MNDFYQIGQLEDWRESPNIQGVILYNADYWVSDCIPCNEQRYNGPEDCRGNPMGTLYVKRLGCQFNTRIASHALLVFFS